MKMKNVALRARLVALTISMLSFVLPTAASDLDLGNVMVNGAKDAAFKFPYTLTWKAGDVREQMIEIPVKIQAKGKQPRDLTFELQNPQNLKLRGTDGKAKNKSYRKVKIKGGLKPDETKVYVRATPNDATRGFG